MHPAIEQFKLRPSDAAPRGSHPGRSLNCRRSSLIARKYSRMRRPQSEWDRHIPKKAGVPRGRPADPTVIDPLDSPAMPRGPATAVWLSDGRALSVSGEDDDEADKALCPLSYSRSSSDGSVVLISGLGVPCSPGIRGVVERDTLNAARMFVFSGRADVG